VRIPALSSHVTDVTGTLTATQITSLDQKLTSFEAQKGSQIAVLMVPTTQPEALEQYSLRVVEQWKLGRKKIDDGVLLIIAKDDRKLRFEVGYGLEGAVNDLTAKRIISEIITPYFKQGLFFEGINAGLNRLMQVIEGEPLPSPQQKSSAPSNSIGDTLEGALVLAFMLSLFLGGVLKRILGKTVGGILTGGIVGVLAFFMTGMIAVAILASIVGFFASLLGGLGGSGGPIIFPGGGGFGGGRGRGGGFGGGGGGFGGGGASGNW
jgi:uncharacterized protein